MVRPTNGHGSAPRVVVIGGGFGGLAAARALGRVPAAVTLVDRKNHHLFQPLLYQVATAALSASDIAATLRRVLRRQRNTEVLLADVSSVDVASRRVILEDGQLDYDYLIVAAGATHSYFGHDEYAAFAPGLKTIEDALEIRRRVLLAFERAEREQDLARRGAWLTFVIVGGGPTGVELAGAFAEIARRTLDGEFRHFDPRSARILLVEGLDRVLPTYAPDLSAKAQKQLERFGVEVRLSTLVSGVDADGVDIGSEHLPSRTVVWAAGVAASPLGRSLGAPLDRAGRVLVSPDLSVPGHPELFVVGDLAAIATDGKPVPGVAPAAMQEGRHAARCVARRIAGKPTQPFRYRDKGLLATVGRGAAVADIRGFHISGFVAWMLWLVVHIMFLVGFRNRVFVMLGWIWSFVSRQRGARVVIRPAGPMPLAQVRAVDGSRAAPSRLTTPTPAPPATSR